MCETDTVVDIAALLADESLALRPVAVPSPGAELRWVATSELDDPSPFLEGGELLLTTGLATKGWRTQWDGYVARLVRAQVAALGIGTGLTHARPPRALVRACEKHRLNLLEVPRETPFVAVSRGAARLIQQREEAEARAALEMQRQLTAAASRTDAREAVVDRLGDLLGGAACLLTPDGRPLRGPTGPARDLLDLDELTAELVRLRPQGLRAAATVGSGERSVVVVPVGLTGRPTQYLAAAVAGRLSDSRRSAVTTAVALLALAVEQDRARLATRRRLAAQALTLLAQGEVETAGILAGVADVPALPGRVQVVRCAGEQDGLEDSLVELERAGFLASLVEDQLWAVGAPVEVARHVDGLAGRGLRVGVGEPVRLRDAAVGHETAALALAQASTGAPVVRWEVVLRQGPMALVDAEVAATFARSFLEGLDEDHLDVLASFLRHHGSKLQVADDLGLHRNTVRNRLADVEARLGRSLDDPATRVSAWLALQARRRPMAGPGH